MRTAGQNQPKGGNLNKFTLCWEDENGETKIQREKEDADDYRYFPDPDLVPVTVSAEWREEVRKGVVELPIQRRQRYEKDYGLTPKEAMVLVEERGNAELFEGAIAAGGSARRVTNLLLQIAMKTANERGVLLPELGIGAEAYAKLAKLADEGTISATAAAGVFEELLKTPGADPKGIAEAKGLVPAGAGCGGDGEVGGGGAGGES